MSYCDNYPDGLSEWDLRYIEGRDENESDEYEDEFWDFEIDKAVGK